MPNPAKELKTLLKTRAELVRSKKHLVYRLDTGVTIVISKTVSDRRAVMNALAEVRRGLGLNSKQRKQKGKNQGG
jgi:hypothetical protein